MLAVAQSRDPRLVSYPSPQEPGRDPLGYAVATDRDWSDDIPAHLATVDGSATLERDGRVERAQENVPLLAGDRLRTDRGRLQVLFADGSSLDLDEFSTIDLLDDALVRLQGGRVRLAIVRSADSLDYRVDAAGTTTFIRASGEYRVSLGDPRVEAPEVRVTVFRGSAELASPFGRTLVRTGMETATTSQTSPSQPYTVSVASRDAFDRWSDDQHDLRVGTTSAQYLPAELRYESGTFDRYGSWEYQQPYGYVWYPVVSSTWYPYYDGRWSYSANYGWFWIGGGRWAWPTHHYGRWGYASSRWYWIPERHWAPAWVSWAYAPGYVSWCPLGYNNLPAVPVGYIGAYRGWTVLPSRAWGPNVAVRPYAVTGMVPASGGFAVQRYGPARPLSGVSPNERPLRAPTASPRYAAPRSQISTIPGSAAGVVATPREPTRAGAPVAPSTETIRRAQPRNVAPGAAALAGTTRPSVTPPASPPQNGAVSRYGPPRPMPVSPAPIDESNGSRYPRTRVPNGPPAPSGPPAGSSGGVVERRNPGSRVAPAAPAPESPRAPAPESGSRARGGGAQPRTPQAAAPAQGAGSGAAQPTGGRIRR